MFNLQKAYNKEGEVSGWMKLCIYLYIFWPPVLEGERETRKFSVPVFDRKKKTRLRPQSHGAAESTAKTHRQIEREIRFWLTSRRCGAGTLS